MGAVAEVSPVVSVLVTLAVTSIAVLALAKKMSDRLGHPRPFDPAPYRNRARPVCCDSDRFCAGALVIRDVSVRTPGKASVS